MTTIEDLNQQAADDLAFQDRLAHDLENANVNAEDVAFLVGQIDSDPLPFTLGPDPTPLNVASGLVDDPIMLAQLEGSAQSSSIVPLLAFAFLAWLMVKGVK
jgi:hypothetical protein